MKLFFVVFVLVSVTVAVQRPLVRKAKRLPFQKKEVTLKAPTKYAKERFVRVDPKSGQEIYYDPMLRIELLDAKSGKYALKWIGYDGKQKTVYYQRPDALDAVVSASVSRTASGQYLYVYDIKNLPSSGQHLSTFALQTFASDVKLIPLGDGYVGQYSHNRAMSVGNWMGFGSTNFGSAVIPGRDAILKVTSYALPGLVECRITGGKQGIEVAGEEPPEELLSLLPEYEAWPAAYTIGPIDTLSNLSKPQRGAYLLKLLPQFQKLGWMAPGASQSYSENLQRNNLNEVYNRAEQDLKNGSITTEVHDIIKTLLGR